VSIIFDVSLALRFRLFSTSNVNAAYLFVYRTYIGLKKSVLDRSLRRWPRLQRNFAAAKNFLRRYVFPSRLVWLQVQSGLAQGMWMRLRIPDEAGFWRGEHEPEVQKALTAVVRPGDVIYDVGAHLGSIALAAAGLVRANGRVVAFDADPSNIERLRENVERNQLQAILQVVHTALWSRAADRGIAFRRGTAGTSQGGVEADGQRAVLADGDIIHVPVITLDDFIAAGNAPPQLIKVDVEGGECEVLRGGANLFAKHRPYLIVEVHHHDAHEWLCAWLERFRYSAEWQIPREGFPRYMMARPQ
jgi:FkbM family methyltransferase